MLSNLVVLEEPLATRRTGVNTVFTVGVHMSFQGSDHVELFFADGTFKEPLSWVVSLKVAGEGRLVEEPLVAHGALEGLGLIVAMYLVMLGKAVISCKHLVAQPALELASAGHHIREGNPFHHHHCGFHCQSGTLLV